MGTKKYRITTISFTWFLFLLLVISCGLKKRINIINCSLGNDKIKVKLECQNFSQKINEAIITNNNDYFVFEEDDIYNVIDKEHIEVELNCSNKEIKMNQEYKITLHFSGGYVSAKIFLGNPIEKIPEIFPCNDFEHIQIIVLEKTSLIGR